MKFMPILFALGAACAWGAYVPTIHHGQAGFGEKNSAIRAFLCVGVAYFLVAVIVPSLLFANKVEPFRFTTKGVSLSTLAGVFGALGALCVIFALKSGGSPLYVAPIVFGLAPLINVFVTMAWTPPSKMPGPLFYAGVIMVAGGVALVLRFKPV